MTDPAGNVHTYSYNDNIGNTGKFIGLLSRVTYPASDGYREYYYRLDANEAQGAQVYSRMEELRSIKANGTTMTQHEYYDTQREFGRISSSGPAPEEPFGPERFGTATDFFSYGFAGEGTYTDITNRKNATSRYEYQPVANAVQKRKSVIRRAIGNIPEATATTEYDPNGFIDYELDFNGNRTEYTYNARGQLEDVTTGINTAFPGQERRTEFDWDPVRNRIDVVREYGATTAQPVSETVYRYYDAVSGFENRLESVSIYNRSPTYGVPNQERRYSFVYTLHPNKLLATVNIDGPQDGIDDTEIYTFNESGDLIRFDDAAGNRTLYSEHNGLGLPGYMKDPNNTETILAYNSRGQLITRTVKLATGDRVTGFEYHPMSMISRIKRPGGSLREFDYYRSGDLKESRVRESASGPSGPVTAFGYDVLGKPSSEQRKQGNAVHYSLSRQYDEIGRLSAEVRNNSQRTEYRYPQPLWHAGLLFAVLGGVLFGSAVQRILAATARQLVVALAPVELVHAVVAHQAINPVPAQQSVVAGSAADHVITAPAFDLIISVHTVNHVVTGRTNEAVVLDGSPDRHRASIAHPPRVDVTGVAHPVPIRVGLRRIGDRRTVVPGIRHAITVGIHNRSCRRDTGERVRHAEQPATRTDGERRVHGRGRIGRGRMADPHRVALNHVAAGPRTRPAVEAIEAARHGDRRRIVDAHHRDRAAGLRAGQGHIHHVGECERIRRDVACQCGAGERVGHARQPAAAPMVRVVFTAVPGLDEAVWQTRTESPWTTVPLVRVQGPPLRP